MYNGPCFVWFCADSLLVLTVFSYELLIFFENGSQFLHVFQNLNEVIIKRLVGHFDYFIKVLYLDFVRHFWIADALYFVHFVFSQRRVIANHNFFNVVHQRMLHHLLLESVRVLLPRLFIVFCLPSWAEFDIWKYFAKILYVMINPILQLSKSQFFDHFLFHMRLP